MRKWWSLRAVRHMTLGAVPAVIVLVAMLIGVIVYERHDTAPLRSTTDTATGTVQRIDSSGHTRRADIAWTDDQGRKHLTKVRFPGGNPPRTHASVVVHYLPGRADRVYVEGDTTYAHASTLLAAETYLLIVLVVVVITVAVRFWRRTRAQRRRPTTVRASRIRTKFGLIQRNWLLFLDNGRERWLPVYWEPELSDLLDDSPLTVHGDLTRNSLVTAKIGDRMIWPAGRIRNRSPRGQHTSNPGVWSEANVRRRESDPAWQPAGQLSMRRQARVDAVLAVAAPFLAALWAYVNGAGVVGLVLALVVLAAFVFWLPSVYGSDPT